MFFQRTTGAFANSLRQQAPFFQENQLNNLGDYNIWPGGFLPRPGVPGGGFTGNYCTTAGSVFTNLNTPPPDCNPQRNMNNASFGEIQQTRGGPRVIQLALKLKF